MKSIIHVLFCSIFLWNIAGAQSTNCVGPLTVTMVGATTNEPITIEQEVSGVYCTESNEGTAFIKVFGGTPEYEYKWNYQGWDKNFMEDLPVGSYQVTVTDANGCTDESTITIVQVDPLTDSLMLVDQSACGDCYMNDGTQSFFYFEEEYIGSLIDITTDKDLGMTTICAEVNDDVTYCQGQPALSRYWHFESDSIEFRNIRLFFSQEELLQLAQEVGFENEIQLINSNGLFVKKFRPDDADCDYGLPQHLYSSEFSITLFDPLEKVWSIELPNMDDACIMLMAKSDAALPVELLTFNGEALEKMNRLHWETSIEVNNEGFILEKSRNGLEFDSIGYVSSKGEFGYNYVFDDIRPWFGSNYYRLKQLDFDGTYEHSHIVHLSREYSFDFKVVNNPITDNLYLEVESDVEIDAFITIFASNGQIVYDQTYTLGDGLTRLQLDLNNLSAGNYLIRFFDKGTNGFLTDKFIKI